MKINFKIIGYYFILITILVFGFLLRLKWLLANPSFWNDECSLAWNVVHQNYLDFFSVLKFTQVAPPLFMVTAKLFTQFFGDSDFILRLAPFLFGTLSIIMFFLISIKIFDKKITVIISNLIFSINQTLINYASEFKQYSCDVFFTLLCFYLFLDLLNNKISNKKCALYSIIFILSLWFSFVSVFTVCSGLLVLFLKKIINKQFNIKQFLILIVAFLLNGFICWHFYIVKNYSLNISELSKYWGHSFISKDFSNFFILVKNIFNYFLYPSPFLLFILIAFLIGLMILFKKKFYAALILFITIVLECFVSWLGYYPFEKRVILFLLPTVLISISSVFEVFDVKQKLKSFFILILFLIIFINPLISVYKYINIPKLSRGYYSREMMTVMAQRIRPGEIIVVDKYSKTDFAYYSHYYKIKNKIIVEGENANRATFINSLSRRKYYWFYFPFGQSKTFDKWIYNKKNKVLFELKGQVHSKLVYVYVK